MRRDEVYRQANFGIIQVDWEGDPKDGPVIWLTTRDKDNSMLISYPVPLKAMRVDAP